MGKATNKRREQVKNARLEIVGKMYKRGHSYRQIQAEVMARLDLQSYSLGTVANDVKTLLAEWRESRIEDVDAAVQLELERIDEAVAELWEQWEKSKEDTTKRQRKKRVPKDAEGGSSQAYEERSESDTVGLGNPSYIAEIRQQLIERRKMLGLYSPEKTVVRNETIPMTLEEINAEIERIEKVYR